MSLMSVTILVESAFRPHNGRLTGQSALILGRGQFCCRTICGMLQAQFQLGGKGLVYLETTCSLLRNGSTEERSNSAFLTKILAGKLPISRFSLITLISALLCPA